GGVGRGRRGGEGARGDGGCRARGGRGGGADPAGLGRLLVIAIVHGPIDVAALTHAVQTEEDGALVTFLGVSRRHSEGKTVLRLEYEAYEPMAITELEQVVRQARDAFGVERIGVVHRIGLVP